MTRFLEKPICNANVKKHQIFLLMLISCLPGLRNRSRDRSWSLSESTVLAAVGVGIGVGNIWPTPTPARSRTLTPAAVYEFTRTIMHSPENIKRQEEKESGSV